jgi:hypothetical protein
MRPAVRFRDRPFKLLALVLCGTIALVAGGADLIDGEISLRRTGHMSIGEAPARFAIFVVGYLIAWSFIILGWFAVIAEWKTDYRLPSKAPLEDPERRRPF